MPLPMNLKWVGPTPLPGPLPILLRRLRKTRRGSGLHGVLAMARIGWFGGPCAIRLGNALCGVVACWRVLAVFRRQFLPGRN